MWNWFLIIIYTYNFLNTLFAYLKLLKLDIKLLLPLLAYVLKEKYIL